MRYICRTYYSKICLFRILRTRKTLPFFYSDGNFPFSMQDRKTGTKRFVKILIACFKHADAGHIMNINLARIFKFWMIFSISSGLKLMRKRLDLLFVFIRQRCTLELFVIKHCLAKKLLKIQALTLYWVMQLFW